MPGVDWDENKNTINKAKHSGLSFEAAQHVFTDPQRIERRDESEGNTSGEERRQTLGMVDKVLMVVYTEMGETKKIISARLAGKAEKGVIMAIIKSTARAGRKIPKEVIQEVRRVAREARKHPEAYDPECPPSSPQAL
ncbi:MAG: BrnT family toxin, partial [Treponema sp.]|nr:BrnT family toxin [Treponema sp.]